MSFDPWIIPYRRVELPSSLPAGEVERRMLQLIARDGEPTSESRPFRGRVADGQVELTVRVPTSGLAAGVTSHERALVVVAGSIEADSSGSVVQLTLRQPLPAFLLLAIVWLGFAFSVATGSSPIVLFAPVSGHAILVAFFRLTAHMRALEPLARQLSGGAASMKGALAE